MRTSRAALLPFAFSFVTAACASTNPAGPSGTSPTDNLVEGLQQQGAAVRRGDVLPLGLPCLSVNGQAVFVNSGSISVFEYANAGAAERDAAKISPDGSGVGSGQCAALITWVGPPHFYKGNRLIVVYAGTDDDVLRPLEGVLGKPFAQPSGA